MFKFYTASIGLVGSVFAQSVAQANEAGLPSWLDAGVAVAAVVLLGYLILMLVRGDIVSRATIKDVVAQAVRESLDEERSR